MEFKLLGSGDGGGGDSMGSVFSQGVPTLDGILDASNEFIQGGFGLAQANANASVQANRDFLEAQMEMNAKKRAESKGRLAMKQENEGTLASMLGQYDSLLEAMSMADDEETKSMIPVVMMGRARLMEAARAQLPVKTMSSFLKQERSSEMTPSMRSAQAAQETASRMQGGEPKQAQKTSGQESSSGGNTKSPPKDAGLELREITV